MENRVTKPKVIIFSAPSGAGKTTIVQHLLGISDLNLAFSVSACSRQQRANESHGKDYYFLGIEGFREKMESNAFLEWEEVYKDNYYGTLRSEIERIFAEGKNVIFDVDVTGGLNLKKQFGDLALAVFVMPPSVAHLEKRLRHRSSETEETLLRRLAKAESELTYSKDFEIVLVNDNLENAFAEAEKIVREFLELPISA